MNSSDPKELAAILLAHLRQLKEDPRAMANLRCALSPVKAPRAWPYLEALGGVGDSCMETVTGLFAVHPEETGVGHLGTTCRLLSTVNRAFEGRFRGLLACDHEEIREMLRPVIVAARAKGIPVNYEALFADLRHWGIRVKALWANEYWPSA